MARAQGARAQLAGAFESAYGTAPGSGFIKFPFIRSTLGAEQGLIADDLLGTGRDPAAPSRDVLTADGDLVVPVDLRNFGHWLKLLLGAPATTGTTGNYSHTFGSGNWTLPSMAVEVGFPEVPHFAVLAGLMANTLSLTMQRAGTVSATIGCRAQGETTATSTAAGTPTEAVLERFVQFQGAIKRDTVALGNVVSADLQYSNNLDPAEVIRADGKIDGLDPSAATMTGNLQTRFADTTLLNLASNGTPVELEFSFTIAAAKKLVITAHKVYLPKPKISLEGPAGVQVPFAWQAAKGTTRMLTAVLTNDVASYA